MSTLSKAPTGRHQASLGQRPRCGARQNTGALKGRPIALDPVWPALSGLDSFFMANPGRCPGLAWHCPVGAQDGRAPKAPTGLPNRKSKAPTERPFQSSKAPTGRFNSSLGQRPRSRVTPPIPAPTGRPNARHRVWSALSGLDSFPVFYPGRCPGLVWICPVGAQDEPSSKAPTRRPFQMSKAPTGRFNSSLGQRPRTHVTPPIPAPTGRPNRNGGAA